MNIGFTFCTGLRCGKGASCRRYMDHLRAWTERDPEAQRLIQEVPVSVAEFSDHNGTCRDDEFQPLRKGDYGGYYDTIKSE